MSTKTVIEIDGNNKSAITAIGGVKKEVLDMNSVVGKAGSQFSNFFKTFGSTISLTALTGAAAGMGALIKTTLNGIDEMYKLSQSIGISVESLSTLKYAGELSGLSLDQLGTGIKKLNQSIFESSAGNKQLQESFRILGVDVKNSNGTLKKADEVMLKISDRFALMGNSANKTALAIRLFGKAGATMIPMLNQGSAAIVTLQEKAEAMGLKINSETAKAAEIFNDRLTSMGKRLEGVKLAISAGLLPQLGLLSKGFETAVDKSEGFFKSLGQMRIKAGDTSYSLESFGLAVTALTLNQLGLLPTAVDKAKGSLAQFNLELDKHGLKSSGFTFGFQPGNFDPANNMLANMLNINSAINMYEEKQKKIREEWEKISQSMKIDISKIGLNDIQVKMIDLRLKADEYIKTFGKRKEIEEWLMKMQSGVLAQERLNLLKEEEKVIDSDILKYIKATEEESERILNLELKIHKLKKEGADLMKDMQRASLEKVFNIGDTAGLTTLTDNLKGMSDVFFNRNQYGFQLDLLKNFYEEKINVMREMGATEMEITAEVENYKSEQVRIAAQQHMEIVAYSFGALSGLAEGYYNLSNQKSKTAFDAYKLFAKAKALVDTYTAATGAYSALVGIPLVGPGLAIAAATSAVLFGLANVARINSIQPGSSGAGGISAGASSPSIPSINNYNNSSNTNRQQIVHITINGHVYDPDKFAREILPSIEKALSDGAGNNVIKI